MNDAVAFPLAYGKEFAVEVAAIFVDRSFAEECVHHDDWRRRCAGLETLCKIWKIESSEMYSLCSRLAYDHEIKVRSLAIFLLSRCFGGSSESLAEHLLLTISKEESRSTRELEAAAHAIKVMQRESRQPLVDSQSIFEDTLKLVAETEAFLESFK